MIQVTKGFTFSVTDYSFQVLMFGWIWTGRNNGRGFETDAIRKRGDYVFAGGDWEMSCYRRYGAAEDEMLKRVIYKRKMLI